MSGGVIGKPNKPTRLRASGIWTVNDLFEAAADAAAGGSTAWPSGNFNVNVGSFIKQNVAGNQDIVIPVDLSAVAAGTWAVVFWTAVYNNPASGVWQSHMVPSVGFVANGGGTISEYSVSASSYDNQATANTSRRMAAKCITLSNPGETTFDEANFVAFPAANTMRINWSSQSAGWTSAPVNYLIMSGLSGAKALLKQYKATVGPQAYTGAGFSPDLVILAHTNDQYSMPESSAHGRLGFGVFNKHGQQWANAFTSADAAAPSDTFRFQQTDSCLIMPHPSTGATYIDAQYSSMDADGFTLNWSSVNGAAPNFIALCLKGLSSKIGAYAATVINGTQAQAVNSRQGFAPKGVVMTNNTWSASTGPNAAAAWSLGATDLVNSRAVSLRDNDALATTSAKAIWFNDKINSTADSNPAARTTVTYSSADESSFTISHTSTSTSDNNNEFMYMLLGGEGTNTFPTSVVASSFGLAQTTLTAYPNQKKLAQLSTGRKIVMINEAGTAGNAYFFWSDDDFQTKTQYSGSNIAGFSNGSIDAYVDSPGAVERLVAVWKQSGTGGGRTDSVIYAMVGTFNTGRTTLTWGTAAALSPADAYSHPDIVVLPEGVGGSGHVVYGYTNAAGNAIYYDRLSIDASGNLTNPSQDQFGAGTSPASSFASICADPATKRLHLAWSSGTSGVGKGVRYRTASYSAGSWTWATEVEVSPDEYIADERHGLRCLWDAGRSLVVIAGYLAPHRVFAYDSSTFTSFTKRIDIAESNAWEYQTQSPSAAVDSNTGDIYVVGGSVVAGTIHAVQYYRLIRSGSTLTASPLVRTDYFGRGTYAHLCALSVTGGIGWIYTFGNSSPYTVKYDRLQLT